MYEVAKRWALNSTGGATSTYLWIRILKHVCTRKQRGNLRLLCGAPLVMLWMVDSSVACLKAVWQQDSVGYQDHWAQRSTSPSFPWQNLLWTGLGTWKYFTNASFCLCSKPPKD